MAITDSDINLSYGGTDGADDEPSVRALRRQINAGAPNGLLTTARTITVKHDASAATNGTALFVATTLGPIGKLYSANAGTADSTFDVSGPETARVVYDADPATNLGAVAVYFVEDGTAEGRLQHEASTFPIDVFIPVGSGRLIKVAYSATASTDGVAVYFDDDGATAAERLLFVSPTTADGSDTTSTDKAMFASID